MAQTDPIYRRSLRRGALRQGEIVTNLVQAHVANVSIRSRNGPLIEPKYHPFAIVLTQDCDLDWDFKARQGDASAEKLIPNVLFGEMVEATALRYGPGMNRSLWERVPQNKDERYHFLEAVPASADRLKQGLPELAMDFKRYFTIPTEEVYLRLDFEAQRRCLLVSPYVEHLSSRFAHYLSRIGLPKDHYSEPTQR